MTYRPGTALGLKEVELTLFQKLIGIRWLLLLLVGGVVAVGVIMLYSAGRGRFEPWADRQLLRFGLGLIAFFVVALSDIRLWMRYAYVFYAFALGLLVLVHFAGTVAMGAQRWLDLGPVNIQPSEMMKLALLIALARYFHGLTYEEIGRPHFLLIPLAMALAPAALVLKQPDLGTTLMLLAGAGAIFFLAGVRAWKFILLIGGALSALPVAWNFLHDYQKRRIYTFLDPESDPLGAGYHILQSKIALGSGGVFGKGFMQGTQSHLNFLPEKQTDFIFTMLAEEFGMMGGLALLALYAGIVVHGYLMALKVNNQFGRLLGMGFITSFSVYVVINMAMVMGVVPVVGVPLPFVSYGGSAMLTLMIGFGLLTNVYIHRDVPIPQFGASH
ncbi:MAG: rod shape-determining protein RodA [Alphaproteobacteria bacterium]|nr:rod shape-determining protein RodA [Alphaproteobacteria bacterium]